MRVFMLMYRRSVWYLERPSVPSSGVVRALELIPDSGSLQSFRGRLIVSSELLWFKVIERSRLSRATHEWFSSSLWSFSRSACNVTLSNFLSWLRENFLPREESRMLLFKVKNCLYYNRFYNSKEKFAKFFIYCIKLNVLLYIELYNTRLVTYLSSKES